MKLIDYLKDRILLIMIFITMIIVVVFLLVMYRVPATLITAIIIVMLLFLLVSIEIDYYRRKGFYQDFLFKLAKLDKKCLIIELMKKPAFLEGKIMYDSLYEIDKSMYEEIGKYQEQLHDFKEYIELWIHEVKIPLASTKLMIYNQEKDTRKLKNQINRIENNVELVLYYSRLGNSEKDYLIKKCDLATIIKNVIKKNQDSLLYHQIKINISEIEKQVLSDSKWLEFIINQIVSNSIKYCRDDHRQIGFKIIDNQNTIALEIIDNGIGIKKSDLPYVFNKSFTGENGRIVGSATGMGLYIVKELCDKLGHQIKIESKVGKYTKVTIYFNDNQYYNVVS